ncbi:ABC transporter substrate-binding protein [uncultured Amnibacterium sp.]|uniref:ABC transporter substrate-binding protein n=1 Tax=uncultured Amnibacterium sp. TaxID=1631851 RepID=UPI0035C9CDD3
MRTKKTLLAAGIAAGTAIALAACSSGPGTKSTSSTGAADTSATVDVGLVLEPTDLNIRTTSGVALDQVLIDNVYQGLVGLDPSGVIHDVLAKSHTVSSDGLTYDFTLNPGTTFSNGDALDGADVVWSLNQVKNTKTDVGNLDLAAVKSITAPSADAVRITLAKPDSELLYALAGRAGLVLDEKATNDLKTTAIGSGPYLLKSWKQGDSITLARNTKYWGTKSKVASVVFHYYTDRSTAVNAALAGDLQVLTAVDPTLKVKFENNQDFTLTKGKSTDKFTLVFNSKKAPLDSLAVRRALRQAIDPKAIIAAVGGDGVAQGGPIPNGDPGFQDLTAVDAYDPAAAKTALASAGVAGKTLTLTIPNFYGTAVTDVLTSQFKAAGVTLKVNSVDFTTWLKNVYTNKDYELSIVDHAEAHDFANWVTPGYYFNYSNPKVNALYAQATAALSQSEADAKLAEAAKLVADDAPAAWLYTGVNQTAIAKTVTGFPTDFTSNRLNLQNLQATK